MFLKIDHPLLPCFIAACVYFAFLAHYLQLHDPDTFIQAGEIFTDATAIPKGLYTVSPNAGYDGQFYYRLALSPFSTEQPSFGITLDTPRYRQQRIMYPLLSAALSFSHPPFVPYALITVNFLGLCALGYVGGRLAQSLESHALFGLLIPLFPGYLFTLARDLTEITEAVFVALGVLYIVEKREWAAAIALSAAVLSKETALLVVAGIALKQVVDWRRRDRVWWAVTLLPLVVYAVWQLLLFSWWGSTPLDGGANFGIPLAGLFAGWQINATSPIATRWLWGVVLLLLFAGMVTSQLTKSISPRAVKIGWLVSAAMLLLLSEKVWIEDLAFARAASLFAILGSIVLLGGVRSIRLLTLFGMCVVWWWVASFRL